METFSETNEDSNSVTEFESKVVQKNEIGQYSCSKCYKQFSLQSNLYTHVNTVHEGIRHPCNRCSKTFTQKIGLLRHIESLHDGVKFPCDLCYFKATTKGNLVVHKKNKH